MLYKTLKRCIERENYISKEDITNKIGILFVNNQLTEEQYNELINMLK
jgi:hypothetical protein